MVSKSSADERTPSEAGTSSRAGRPTRHRGLPAPDEEVGDRNQPLELRQLRSACPPGLRPRALVVTHGRGRSTSAPPVDDARPRPRDPTATGRISHTGRPGARMQRPGERLWSRKQPAPRCGLRSSCRPSRRSPTTGAGTSRPAGSSRTSTGPSTDPEAPSCSPGPRRRQSSSLVSSALAPSRFEAIGPPG